VNEGIEIRIKSDGRGRGRKNMVTFFLFLSMYFETTFSLFIKGVQVFLFGFGALSHLFLFFFFLVTLSPISNQEIFYFQLLDHQSNIKFEISLFIKYGKTKKNLFIFPHDGTSRGAMKKSKVIW